MNVQTTGDLRQKRVVDQIFGGNKAPIEDVLRADYSDVIAKAEDLIERLKAAPKTIANAEANALVGRMITDARAVISEIQSHRVEAGRPVLEAQRGINGFFNDLGDMIGVKVGPITAAADDFARRVAAEARAKAQRDAADAAERAAAEREKAASAATTSTAARAEGRAEVFQAKAEQAEAAAASSAADLTRSRVGGVTSSARTGWVYTITDYAALIAPFGPIGNFLDREAVEKAIRSMVRVQKGATSIPGVTVFQDVKASFR